LLGGFVKFGFCVILEAALKSFQNLGRRLAGSADDEDAIETALVFSICIRQSDLHDSLGVCYMPLLLRRPVYGLG
jgi:hypothetical protein